MTSGGTLIHQGFTVTAGAGALTLTPGLGTITLTATNSLPSAFASYNILSTTTTGITTLGAATTVDTLTIGSGTTLSTGGSNFNMNVSGEWTNNGSFTQGTGTVTFNGGSGQTMNGSTSTTFNGLTINNAAGITLGANETVNATLTLTSGNVTTGSNTLSIGGSGSVTHTSGHIIGNLKRTYSATGSKPFDVGTANGYSPVTVNATAGTGDFTVKAVQGAQPNVIGSNVLQRDWKLTSSGITQADLTFNYLAGDVVGTEASYVVAKYASSWDVKGGTINTGTHAASVTGITSFSDWTLAEPASLLSLSINDVTVSEGNSGTTTAGFTVTLSGTSSQSVSVNYSTSDGTATTSDADYTGIGSTALTFSAGQTSKSVNVTVNGDTKFETNESFNVNLSGAANASISDNLGVGTITNDDSQPTISIDDVSHAAGNSGTTSFGFTVSLSNASYQTITVNYATSDGTAATADGDYTGIGTTGLTFTPGQTSKPVTVLANGDNKFESNETFNVDLSAPANATIADNQGVGTISNDDPIPAITINDVSVTEGNSGTTSANFTVSLSNPSSQTIMVDYATANVTATAGSDYAASSGTLTFTPGTTTQPVTVTVNGDVAHEPDETYHVDLSNAANATISVAQGGGTITNDDAAPTITINDGSGTRGNRGTSDATAPVSLSNPSSSTVTVDYATANGTAATADNDYDAGSGTLTIPAGKTSATVHATTN